MAIIAAAIMIPNTKSPTALSLILSASLLLDYWMQRLNKIQNGKLDARTYFKALENNI